MNIAYLNPDIALKALINNKIKVRVSDTEERLVKVYASGEQPNTNLADEFINVDWNGVTRSLTEPLGLFTGTLILTIWAKAYPDGRANKIVTRRIIEQVYTYVDRMTEGEYHYTIDADNVVMPITIDNSTGYSTMAINVRWHTTKE